MHRIEEALAHFKQGGMLIVTDAQDRENEGDLVIASQWADEAAIGFMALYGRGLICMAIEEETAERLQLQQMVRRNTEGMNTAFTVSVDAREGTSTGISPADRAATVRTILNPVSSPGDLQRPGHLFPLLARPGGVLQRPGHTEAAVDLARLAGLIPSGVICEIMDDDGRMARLPRLKALSRQWDIPHISIEDLIRYRREKQPTETLPSPMPPAPSAVAHMPLESGAFKILAFPEEIQGGTESVALVLNMDEEKSCLQKTPPLVRIHSECLTGESLGSLRCDCGFQLKESLRRIQQEGRGALIYLRQEGRGIGLMEKLKAYELQDRGIDTLDANTLLGHPADGRSYQRGTDILKSLGIKRCRLLTNNPSKLSALTEAGIEVTERVAIEKKPDRYSRSYVQTKIQRFGHLYSPEIKENL